MVRSLYVRVSRDKKRLKISLFFKECVLLQTRIFCYGGALGSLDYPGRPYSVLQDDIFIRLDLSGAYSLTELQNMWEIPDGPTVGANFYFAMAALPNNNSIFIDGGRGLKIGDIGEGQGDIPQHIASIYNASGNGSWLSVNTTGRNRM